MYPVEQQVNLLLSKFCLFSESTTSNRRANDSLHLRQVNISAHFNTTLARRSSDHLLLLEFQSFNIFQEENIPAPFHISQSPIIPVSIPLPAFPTPPRPVLYTCGGNSPARLRRRRRRLASYWSSVLTAPAPTSLGSSGGRSRSAYSSAPQVLVQDAGQCPHLSPQEAAAAASFAPHSPQQSAACRCCCCCCQVPSLARGLRIASHQSLRCCPACCVAVCPRVFMNEPEAAAAAAYRSLGTGGHEHN